MLKTFLSTALSLFIAFSAQAKPCAECDSAKKLTAELHALSYANADDRTKGYEKAELTVNQLTDFRKLKKTDPTRIDIFKSLLNLSREASPYDEEGQIAELMATILTEDSTLNKLYNDSIHLFPKAPRAELCKSQDIEKTVAEQLCYIASGEKGQDTSNPKIEAKVKACISKFSFDVCLKMSEHK